MDTEKLKNYIKLTAKEWSGHNPLLLGAAISFYILLASGPILTLLIMVLGTIFGEQAASGKIINEINSVVGDKAADVIAYIIEKASSSNKKLLTILTSIPLMLFGSTMVFFQVKNALDTLWEGELKSKPDFSQKLKEYLLAVLMLFITGAFFFLLMSKTIIITSSNDFFGNFFSSNPVLSGILNIVITFMLVTMFFTMVYKVLIKHKMSWKHIITGAIVTSVLFSIIQILVGINFNLSNIDTAYGAIGSLTIWILWIFYSSLVFLFGASFLKVYSRQNSNNK
jgi:membrane protein